MSNIVVHEESEADKSYRIHYAKLSQVDHDWYVAQTKFAINILRDLVIEMKVDGKDYEPGLPNEWSIKFDAAGPYVLYLHNIERMISSVYDDKLGKHEFIPRPLENYPLSMRPDRKPRPAFDNQPQKETPLTLAIDILPS